jgi:hypothetical protein
MQADPDLTLVNQPELPPRRSGFPSVLFADDVLSMIL